MEILEKEYAEVCGKYVRLAQNIKESLKILLKDAGIDILDVHERVKAFDSFQEKIQRKSYSNPFGQIEDICGLRVICYYPSDIEKIARVIHEEFDVREAIDKSNLLDPDQFGYRSRHFIITIKDKWLTVPNFRDLAGLKAEIQVRTILMHAWADIEHKLSYKKVNHIPPQFKRKFSQLSALFELADERFEDLRMEKEALIRTLVSEEHRFDTSQHLNADSLQAFLDFYFSNRKRDHLVTELLDTLQRYDITFADLVNGYEKVRDFLPELERDTIREYFLKSGIYDAELDRDGKIWSQTGIVRTILDLTHDEYWSTRPEPAKPEYKVKLRDMLKSHFNV